MSAESFFKIGWKIPFVDKAIRDHTYIKLEKISSPKTPSPLSPNFTAKSSPKYTFSTKIRIFGGFGLKILNFQWIFNLIQA